MLNLINKTSKQAKYKQRHWNKKQADTNQGGDNRENGEGLSRSMYKGHMGKAEWGERWGKMETTVLEQQFKKGKEEEEKLFQFCVDLSF